MFNYGTVPANVRAAMTDESFRVYAKSGEGEMGDAELLIMEDIGENFFGEGISAKPLTLVENGVLKNYYVDTYYGRKLNLPPTTGSMSNLDWQLGQRSFEQILADMQEGVLITSFLGGNSNDTTGDFSVGIRGFYIRGGKREHPLSEMNITGNHLRIWKRLVEVGNQPYPYSSYRCPALLFDDLQVSGS